MDWKACEKKDLIKATKADHNLVKSLIESSKKKILSNDMLPLNDTTAASKIALVYDALRELLEAIASVKGFKIYNHECYCAFFSEILNLSGLADTFDQFRKLRNAINYYGKDVTAEEARKTIHDMYNFIDQLKKLLDL